MGDSDELRFDGRVAVITGAGRGIGRAHALLLASRGAAVIVNDLGGDTAGSGFSTEPADAVVEEIVAAGGIAAASYASVADEAAAASIVQLAFERFGRLDIVINNAGNIAPLAWFEDQPLSAYRSIMDVHYFGTLNVCRAAWPHLIAARYGRIVNTTSAVFLGFQRSAPYNGAKAAVYGLTMTLAAEGARHGIRANCLNPSAASRMVDAAYSSGEVEFDLKRRAQAAAAAGAPALAAPGAAFLAHESCQLSGAFIRIGGGLVASSHFVITDGLTDQSLTPEMLRDHLGEIMDEGTAHRYTLEG